MLCCTCDVFISFECVFIWLELAIQICSGKGESQKAYKIPRKTVESEFFVRPSPCTFTKEGLYPNYFPRHFAKILKHIIQTTCAYTASNYMFKVKNRNTRCGICSKSTIKTLERRLILVFL